MPKPIRAFAPAKVNLSLKVHGRRADGYHELTSLVAFADVGDTLTLLPSREFSLSVTGPMSQRIDGPNLIEVAAERLVSLSPDITPGAVTLHKVLPIGAGIGGGSSDVAAYLRAVRQVNSSRAEIIDWQALALSLGADVPICLSGRTAWMCGIGETVHPVHLPVELRHAVLVNPGISVLTGPVFQELDAPPLQTSDGPPMPADDVTSPVLAETLSNDLEVPALRLYPKIAAARDILTSCAGLKAVRMSGSGSTYFGIFESLDAARAAAETIADHRPQWWVKATVLGNASADLRDETVNSHG